MSTLGMCLWQGRFLGHHDGRKSVAEADVVSGLGDDTGDRAATEPRGGAVDHDGVMVVPVCPLVHPGEVQCS